MSTDLLQRHRAAVRTATDLVARVGDGDLVRPTPCARWDLRQLLEHMVGQHTGFAAVVRDGEAGLDAYRPLPFTAATWRTSVDDLLDAFAGADLAARVVELELHPTRQLPVEVLVQAQFLDTVVHTWDIAAALGEPFAPDDFVAASVLRIAEPIPDDERRRRPDAAFGPVVAPSDGSTWARALAILGRDPAWRV